MEGYKKIAKYYDIETLTQENLDSEIKRLSEEIKRLQDILIFLEKEDPNNSDILDFYEERYKLFVQLNTIYEYLSYKSSERTKEYLKDSRLRSIYGRLPDWRLEEKKKSQH